MTTYNPKYDPKLAKLFYANFTEAYRSSKLLLSSHERLATLFPLQPEQLKQLSIDDIEKLDAFRVRFCDVQDVIGNKVFRSILLLEEEQAGTPLDILNKMEKRRIINTFNEWKNIRNIRNLFSHDYPESDSQKREAMNEAYQATPILLHIVNHIIHYVDHKIQLAMQEFPSLK